MIIKLVRHGQSQQNTGAVNATEIGDHNVPLSDLGWTQSRHAGHTIGSSFLSQALVYVSPYLRTRQTLTGIIDGSDVLREFGGITIYEDIRLREVEFGFNKSSQDIDVEQNMRKTHGYMFYRYKGGESPADCYDRLCSFMESMARQCERKKNYRVLIVTHGIVIRCFVTRFLHLTVEEFDLMKNPANGAIITISDQNMLTESVSFRHKKWAVSGLQLRDE